MTVKKRTRLLALLLGLMMLLSACSGEAAAKSKKKNAAVTTPPAAAAPAAPAEKPGTAGEQEKEDPIISPQGIADYIFEHGELPPNFITKKEAMALGWQKKYKTVAQAAPGKSIGGDRFGNYQGKLPRKHGRTWYEADCNYISGNRKEERIVYSSDGLVYYTGDHYQTFTEMKPSGP